jgi:nucleoid-associated protein YgaU
VETDMTVMQGRMREMEQNLQDLQAQVLEQQYRKENPKPVKKYVPPPAPEKWPKLHKTEAGETLRSIASRYYGNPSLWERIYEANEKNISKGLPVEGSILTIPPPPVKEK